MEHAPTKKKSSSGASYTDGAQQAQEGGCLRMLFGFMIKKSRPFTARLIFQITTLPVLATTCSTIEQDYRSAGVSVGWPHYTATTRSSRFSV